MSTMVVWTEKLLSYNPGKHPFDPVRLELTMALSHELGLLGRPGVSVAEPRPASDETITRVHERAYLDAVRSAPYDPLFSGWGLGTADNPVFAGMHEAAAGVAGASVRAAQAVWRCETQRAVNIAGGLHHAMPASASGFCIYNDAAIAIAHLLDLGAERLAYVDIDAHHGDGVQAVFWDDPRVLTISLHESPLTLFPGTGFPDETGGPRAGGTVVNVALPAGTDDAGWLRAFHAVVPPALRQFRPQVLFTCCGADTYRYDPLANLQVTIDGQRASYLALRDLADELCDGRWVAFGGGGYALFEGPPRAWTHLIAIMTGEPLPADAPVPEAWQDLARQRLRAEVPTWRLVPDGPGIPTRMSDRDDASFERWQPGEDSTPLDRAIAATRERALPLLGAAT